MNESGELNLYYGRKPKIKIGLDKIKFWDGNLIYITLKLKSLFPEITFENSPQEVELKLIEK